MQKKVALHTLGCKLNFSETSTIGKQFLDMEFSIVDLQGNPDIVVFNTCTVTENAEKDCRQMVRRVLRHSPDAYIIVTGCYAQLRPEEILNIEGVDAVLGSQEKFSIFSLINDFDKNLPSCVFVSPTEELNSQFGSASSSDADSRTRAYFKIQDGCDYKCTFCTIPLARGKSRSMEPELVLSEFKNLLSQGYKEIILTGVNVGDYGKSYELNFYNILKKLVEVEGEFRIRISSIEPNLLSDEIINLAADNPKICNHFHIPLQSGSTDILQSMQRRYKANEYESVIHKLNSKIVDVGIGVDVIVGFPGETEEHFLETYNFIKDLPISYLHVFTYSERPDTKALQIVDKVSIPERKKRNNMLRILSEKKRSAFYESMIGKDLQVLFESDNKSGKIHGFSSNYVRVSNDYENELVNKLSMVKINQIFDGLAIGELKEIKNSVAL